VAALKKKIVLPLREATPSHRKQQDSLTSHDSER
jgi:hypothetical protein